MLWWQKYFLMDKAGEGGDGGGGAGDDGKGGKGAEGGNKDYEALKAQNEALTKRLEALEKGSKGGGSGDDPSLLEKAKRDREAAEKSRADGAALESALTFDLKSEAWLKENSAILPKDIGDIFATAKKETYDSAVQKVADIKAGVVQAYFAVQSNMDMLTPNQKIQVEDYLKLTKDGRQAKAQAIYDQIFEPTFEMAKKLRKATLLQKGHGTGSDDSYKQKLLAGARKHYLREKKDA